MLYEKYEAKVKRSIARRNFFLKYKYYFIALCSILIISMSTLFYMKGKISGDILVPDIKYGQKVEVKDGLSAIMSKHYLEFKGINEESWSNEMPSVAGTYHVRGVSNGIFGRRYSKVFEFAINKETLDVKFEGPVKYDESPIIKFITSGNDTVVEDSYKLVIEKYEDRKVKGYIDTTNLKIVNSANQDVTSSYDYKDKYEFEVGYYDYKLDLNLTDIKDYEYNGLKFDSKQIEVLGLVNSLKIDYDYDILDVNGASYKNTELIPGRYKLVLSNIKLTDNGNDVTKYYKFDTELVKEFNVYKRNITIKTKDITKVYDSVKVCDNEYLLEGTILDSHVIDITSFTEVCDAGVYENKLVVSIYDFAGKDISEYYNITYIYGTITINKVDLTISPLTQPNKVYDGTSFIYPETDLNFEVLNGELVNDESFKLIVNCYKDNKLVNIIKDSGVYRIECINVLFSKGILENYNITFKNIDFNILKRNIEIKFNKETFTYDTTIHRHSNNFEIISGEFVKGEQLTVYNETYYSNAGNYFYEPKLFYVNGLDPINYNILSNNIEVEILKANVEVRVENELAAYNGRKIYPAEYNLRITVLNSQYYTPNQIKWHFEQNLEAKPYIMDAGVYDIVVDSLVDSNFDVKIVNKATFEITKANVQVRPKDLSHTYDGNVYVAPNDSYEVISGTFFDDDRIDTIGLSYYQNDLLVEPKNVGYYNTKISNITLLNTSDSNYDITFIDGNFECIKRDVYFNLVSVKKTYDGQKFIYPTDSFTYKPNTPYKLVLDDKIEVDVIVLNNMSQRVNPIDCGTYTLTLNSFKFITGDANNYNISFSDATLEINKANLVVDFLAINDKVYDGVGYTYPNSDNNFTIVEGQLFNNDSFAIVPYYINDNGDVVSEPRNVGTYRLKLNETVFSSGNEFNYNITTNDSAFRVLKREVTVAPIVSTKEFDGNTFDYALAYNGAFNIVSGSIVANENFGINVEYKLTEAPTKVGTYKLYVKDVYALDTNSDINNYKFTFDSSTLEITKCNVSVELLNTKLAYNAKVVDINNIDTKVINLPFGFDLDLTLEFKVGVDVVVDVKNVGTYNVCISNASVSKASLDVSENFNVTYNTNSAILEITPSDLTIKLGEKLTKEYDGLVYLYKDKPVIVGAVGDSVINIDSIEYYDNTNNLVDPINAGQYTAKIKAYSFSNPLDAINYNIILEDSLLNITKRVVTLNVNKLDHIYDSTVYNNPKLTYSLALNSNDFIESDSITLGNAYFYLNDKLVNPVDVNSYIVRPVIEDITYNLNINNYNIIINDGVLNITPRKVKLTLEEVTSYCYNGTLFKYVNKNPLKADGLLNNDKFTVSLTFRNQNDGKLYDIINNIGTYQVNSAKYLFTNGNINNYEIEIVNYFMFEVTSKEITITTDNFNATYQGMNNKFTLDQFTVVGALFEGDQVFCNTPFVCVNAGTYKNEVKVIIKDKNGQDITNLYKINYIYGDVVINKVDLFINYDQESIIKNYDKALLNLNYSLVGNLDPLNIDFIYRDFKTNNTILHPILVGHYKAYIEVTDTNILTNYNVVVNDGQDIYKEITINPVNLTITTNTSVLNYIPGKAQSDALVGAEGLVDGDITYVIKESITTIMLPGSVVNKLKVNILNSDGLDVTNCYTITYKYGTLSINDTLIFNKIDKLKVYDGLAYDNSHLYNLPIVNGNKDLMNDIKITLYFDPTVSLVDAKVYRNVVSRIEIEYIPSEVNKYTPDEVLQYINSLKYDLSTIEVEITKRDVMIKPKDYSKTYDGTPLLDDLSDSTNYIIMPSKEANDINYGLLAGHSLSVVTELTTKYYQADAFSARYMITDAFVMNGNVDVSSNYNIIKGYERQPEDTDYTYNKKNREFMARARIKRRTIYLETGSINTYYNGSKQYCNVVEVIKTNDPTAQLLDSHDYMVDINSCGYIEKGTYKNRVRIIIYDSNGLDVTNNYRLSYMYSTGTITII